MIDREERGAGSQRVVVSAACAAPCPSCVACRPGGPSPTLDDVLAYFGDPDLFLGGGDATRWPPLFELLARNAVRPTPQRIWIEAPARSLTHDVLVELARARAHGVRVFIEGMGREVTKLLGVGDGEAVIADAEALGLATEARVGVRPRTFPMLVPLARRLMPRTVWLEIVRQDWGAPPVAMPVRAIDRALAVSPNVRFAADRMSRTGYLPPCVMPETWAAHGAAWRATETRRTAPNGALPICGDCALRSRCRWDDAGALSDDARAEARPIVRLRERHRATEQPVPDIIVRRRPEPAVACVTPWTTMEIVDPDGLARQCCSTWTLGDRGNVSRSSMMEVWNGPGYQLARRQMGKASVAELCQPICSRLHDLKFAEKNFRIQTGTEPFVRNQLLMAEEIADRTEIVRSLPLRIALCPSTYCNYDCIMCDHGRTPRRDLPDSIWEELPRFLPTLQSLTLLGGEPLANPHTWKFLRAFDKASFPDASVDIVTNGSLLTEAALKQIRSCPLGDVTVSLNAGTAEVYERVQRGIAFDDVLQNLDALIRFRDGLPFWFGITVGFVVQPAAAHTLVQFGEIAHARHLRIRLMALNPENHEGLDFYTDPDEVARVVEHVDAFVGWAERMRPEWLHEIRATRAAVLEEAAVRQAGARSLVPLRLSASAPR